MANTKSAKKRIRQSARGRERNRSYRTRMRGAIRALRADADAGNTEAVVRFVETKCIESYRNGVEQGQASPAFRAPLLW